MRGRAWRCASPLLCAAIWACAGSGDGLDAGGRPLDESPPPGPPSDFQRIQETIFTPICTQCHAGAGAPLGLRLDAGNSHALLVNVASAQVPGLLRVRPGDPDSSYLVHKIEGRAAVGGRMPLGGPALPQQQIDLIRGWIAAGATQANAARETPFHVVSTIPAAGEVAWRIDHVMLVFNTAVDAALISHETLALTTDGGEPRTDRGDARAIALARVEASLMNPSVVSLETREPLPPGRYRLVIRGDGVTPLADVDAQVLDGDGDGRAGGDFTLQFEVDAGGGP